ncbi:hypothetical protein Syun_005851 [Stephania yunnanensis]|uniref:Bromo domain-containing protein n=1 Tax=Stephania yunnanensis TaxID=152371 RepID=A0AAP0KY43_9MAGN
MDESGSSRPVRTSDRLRRRPSIYGRGFMYYAQPIKNKSKRRTAASQIAKMLQPGRHVRNANASSVNQNLRRSTRKRKMSRNLEGYATDSSATDDEDLMTQGRKFHPSRATGSQDKLSRRPKRKKILQTKAPRREGLRPRRSKIMLTEQSDQEFDDEQGTSEEQVDDETENGNDVEGDEGEDEGEAGDEEEDGDGADDVEENGDDEDGEEEQDVRRRYDLRNREVRRLSPEKEGKQRQRSPRRVLHQGVGTKSGRDVRKGGRIHKRHRLARAEDSDDSLLVDELDQGPTIPWARGGTRNAVPWLLGGLDMPGATSWGLNVAASGWGHQSDLMSSLTAGAQTAGPSSKGGADIQPLQVDESVSFDDIGGLSDYVDALKEMVFFPLLYPDFFEQYHITPPRGVLLCGPPGTGKTLIARALACAASKAGKKVSFYMRKGADVLSKWVGEAERQLKLLFEEAQKNQPSIIFFDEIDGLAPVRSSKQEQIHNSIVSTLLALMDGLDSRGQVVLIGATNRIDAIDGALRRPGRFDREFNFPLPGLEARTEILDIHTRKWKRPPSKELKMELAASCVGYCGADLKALCTEAAIRAFREKYPQVYTSDDKFLIDVDSIKVEKYHFLEAMSTITPAAHRGSIVHSRPLSIVVAPFLSRHLQKVMDRISEIFPSLASSSDMRKFSVLSYGPAVPLAHEQLRAVLLTLLEELPSDSPILLLGTSLVLFEQLDEVATSIFAQRNVYEVEKPTLEDRSLFFERLIEAVSSIPPDGNSQKSQESKSLSELPKAPKAPSGPKASELRAKAEAEQHALRRMRMCLRDICNRILCEKKYVVFHYPVMEEDVPDYHSIVQNPMDIATVLQRVDCGHYITCSAFVQDIDLILSNAKAYNGADYNGARIVSRAYELRDSVHGMLSQMDPALVSFCDKIAAQGGPMQLPEDMEGFTLPATPVVQMATVTRASARLRNVQPEVNISQSYEALRRSKKIVEIESADDKTPHTESDQPKPESAQRAPSQEPEANGVVVEKEEETPATDAQLETSGDTSVEATENTKEDAIMTDGEVSSQVESIKQLFVERTEGYDVPQLERLYSRVVKGALEIKGDAVEGDHKASALKFLLSFAEREENF